MKRRIFALLISSVVLFTGCAGMADSMDKPTPSATSSFDKESANKLKSSILLELDGYDVNVSAFDSDDDGRLDVHVTVHGGITIDKYIFGMVAEKTMKIVKSDLEYCTEEIGCVEITGIGNERVIRWTTFDLSTGDFSDVPHDPAGFYKKNDMTLQEVLSYCEYSK